MKDILAFDLETTGLDVHSCRILGVALCLQPGEAHYVPLPEDRDEAMKILNRLRSYFEDPDIPKLGHNLKFDINVLRQYGIKVIGKIIDTMVMDYVLHPNRKKHGLKEISKIHLNYEQIKFDDVAQGIKKNKTLEGVDPKIVKDYACEDIDLTYQLYNYLLPKIQDQNLQEVMDLDCKLVPVIADMEYHGVLIDQIKLAAYESTIEQKMVEHLRDIEKYTEGNVNIKSKAQLSRFLFGRLDLTPIGPKGKSGHYSVSKEVLKELLPQHDIVRALLDYNALNKVKSTFIPALKRINPVTGRLHTSFNQTVTETGRFSSSGPNLQNMPKDPIIRELFYASEGSILIGADYSNIELRVMAALSQDPEMLKAYKNDQDLHIATASRIFKIPAEDLNDKSMERKVAKTVNFGLIYGMAEHGLSKRLRGEGLDYSPEECKQLISDYFESYPGVAKCCEDLIYRASINGYAETIFGRRRPLNRINSPIQSERNSAKRLAMNTPIQGSAADILRMAMVNIHKRIQKENLRSKMILQVHDELLFEVPDDEVKYMEKLVKSEMENVVHLSVPLKVDLKIGQTWADVH